MKMRITFIEDESEQFFNLTEKEIKAFHTLANCPVFKMLTGSDAPVFSVPICHRCHIRDSNTDTGLCFTCEYATQQ